MGVMIRYFTLNLLFEGTLLDLSANKLLRDCNIMDKCELHNA